MTHITEGINTEEISNNNLFARKLSGRTDLDLFYATISQVEGSEGSPFSFALTNSLTNSGSWLFKL